MNAGESPFRHNGYVRPNVVISLGWDAATREGAEVAAKMGWTFNHAGRPETGKGKTAERKRQRKNRKQGRGK